MSFSEETIFLNSFEGKIFFYSLGETLCIILYH